MYGLSFLALIILAIGVIVAYRAGVLRGSREGEAEGGRLRREIAERAAESWQMHEFAEDRRGLLRAIADSRDERHLRRAGCHRGQHPQRRYDGLPRGAVGRHAGVAGGLGRPHRIEELGISSYRQIARWTDRDIDDFNARLPDFSGRIRRDAWVTQARELHQSKYGESLPPREHG